jgi:hypothetical protein
MTELANHIYGDILTENPAVAQSAFGPHRVITDRWKGMSPEQLADIRRQQDLQRRERMVSYIIHVFNWSLNLPYMSTIKTKKIFILKLINNHL